MTLNMKKYLSVLLSFSTGVVYAQSAQLTPVMNIGMHTVAVTIPAKFGTVFPSGKTLNIPSGYTVSVYHAGGINKPRFMAFSPGGVLHVSDMGAGKIIALPDANADGVADTMIEAATGFSNNHDVTFYKGAMYVTETTRIWKCTDTNLDGIYETKTIFISNIGNNQTTGHITRTLVFDSVNQKAYVSVGSSCNVCRETARAVIEQYNEDGTGGRVFSSGVRNAVGMAIHPVTNRLWANNNGSDQQGNEVPPEWIDIVRDNGFYGHPFAYGGGEWFDFNAHSDYQALLPLTTVDSSKVASMIQPAALIRAHSAPMELTFLNPQFGTILQHGFLSALRGSWNTTDPKDFRGYKVIYAHLSSAQDTTVDYVADFCSGFITDTVNRVYWGRPVGIAIDNNGKVYISSDEGNKFILVLTPDKTTGTADHNPLLSAAAVYPNPVRDAFTIDMTMARPANVRIVLKDMFGRTVKEVPVQHLSVGNMQQQMDITGLIPGTYFLNITVGEYSIVKKIILVD
jgi:glucose/arabinose dehydrogenase